MARWNFETKLVRPEGIGTWTFAPIPVDIARDTGIKARLRVRGRIDGVPFAGTLLPVGVVIPDDMARALAKSSAARSVFEDMAPSHKKAYIDWIEEAEKPATRTKRISKALNMIATGKHL